MKPQSPCYDCKERHFLCHSKCTAYMSFRSNLDHYNDRVRKRKQLEQAHRDLDFQACQPNYRRRK